ncbi:MAG: putative manganese-dependent inorganic diphosphatase, partial [Clostridiaceae bacterium]|nr:putative manganese-dependent inorganic diphosphatase [Clostridiaceae bacterium]
MDNKVYIIGHKNPDTDSICSAIAYAYLKQKLGINAIPVRLGKINRETAFVLDYFGVKEPEYLATVKVQAQNFDMDKVKPVTKDITLKSAWGKLKEENSEVLPICDEEGRLIGIISVSDIANAYMNMPPYDVFLKSCTPLKNVVETLEGKMIAQGPKYLEARRVFIADGKPEGMLWQIHEGDIVICGDKAENQSTAIEFGTKCLIVTGGAGVLQHILDEAQKRQCAVIVTRYDTFTVARLLYQSLPVSYFMTKENIVKFKTTDYADDIKDIMQSTRFRSYPVVDEENRFVGFISRYHLIRRQKKRVILIDHSDKSQTVDGIDEARILEIIDHHRIGDIQTDQPIYYRNEPVGCTATIIYHMFCEHNIKIPKKIAGILCAAILSDTVIFKSPTCTAEDKEVAKRLANTAGIDLFSFAKEMIYQGSQISGMTVLDII